MPGRINDESLAYDMAVVMDPYMTTASQLRVYFDQFCDAPPDEKRAYGVEELWSTRDAESTSLFLAAYMGRFNNGTLAHRLGLNVQAYVKAAHEAAEDMDHQYRVSEELEEVGNQVTFGDVKTFGSYTFEELSELSDEGKLTALRRTQANKAFVEELAGIFGVEDLSQLGEHGILRVLRLGNTMLHGGGYREIR
ncbi:MAG TPA: hypothetical protein VL989_02280 [Candidatus Sulfotelmatobacter sp.]|nr:hypothetical protein [Candidatus Sulfotelmatobacter sp.]